jgi:hypothetical protein
MQRLKCFFGLLICPFFLLAQANYTSGTLIGEDKTEIKVFNNLYWQNESFNESGNRTDNNRRDTYFTAIVSVVRGYSEKTDIGVDLYPKYVKVSPKNGTAVSRSALAAIAPKIKFRLSDKLPNITAQSSFVLPIGKDLEGGEGQPFLDYDDLQWWNQVYYQKQMNEKWLFFGETGVLFRYDLADENKVHEWVFPVKALFQYSPNPKFTAYTLTEIAPSTNQNYYTQLGAGAKYQLSNKLLVETLGTVFPIGKNKGAGQTLNLGFRAVF